MPARSPARERALLLVVAVLLAGCAAPDAPPTPAADPTPASTPLAPSPTPPSAPRGNATFRLLDLEAAPAVVDLGLPVELLARIVNEGDGAGVAKLRFEIVGGTSREASAAADPGRETVARASLPTSVPGNATARVHLGAATSEASFRVVSPRIAEMTLRAEAVEPCGAVRITTGFLNAGDGRARNTRADLELSRMNGENIARYATRIGDVPAGERAESVAETSDLRAVCAGEEKRGYPVALVVHADGVLPSRLSGMIYV